MVIGKIGLFPFTVATIRKDNIVNFIGINFNVSVYNIRCVPHQNRVDATVLIRGHNICKKISQNHAQKAYLRWSSDECKRLRIRPKHTKGGI